MTLNFKLFISTLIVFFLSGISYAKSDTFDYDYSLSGISIAKEGNYLVEVSVTVDKKKEATIDIVKQYAILGCLYKGFSIDRIFQKPILSQSLNDIDNDYIRRLILHEYNSYTSSSYPLQIVKVGKKFRVTGIILVSKDNLREKLEETGILRKLGL